MYTKIIKSGQLIEVFEYEKDPPEFRPRKKSRQRNPRRYRRNVSRARSSFFRLVQANLGTGITPAFLTLTMREIVPLREGWRAYTRFTDKFRRQTRGRCAFVGVPEFQERGAVHFHCLVWGLTDEEISSERSTRRIAKLWSHGFVDILKSDGSPKLAGYLAKYMFKAMWDERLAGAKSYSASRSLVRSVSLKSKTAVSYIEAEIRGDRINTDGTISQGVDSPLVPEIEKEYSTEWMGKCVYKVYRM